MFERFFTVHEKLVLLPLLDSFIYHYKIYVFSPSYITCFKSLPSDIDKAIPPFLRLLFARYIFSIL